MAQKNKIDKSNLREVILGSADQLREGLKLAKNVKVEGGFENIVVCGIGGSALPVNILTYFDLNIPVYIHRDYDLPKTANENSLIICISYSGNTEETLSALSKAIDEKLKVVGMSSGGEVEKICLQNDIPFIKIPSGIQPRCATGYIFSALVKLLENSGLLKNISSEILKTSEELQKISLSLGGEGKKLAKKLVKKIPVIYASNNLKFLARIWKIKLNENSKIPAFWNYFPELNHNEMVGYTNSKKDLFVIIIKDLADHSRVLKRMDLTAKLLLKSGIKTEIINVDEGSSSFKIFSTLLLGDWTSYYLALENKIDPTPVKMVEEFKKLMAK